MKRILIVEDNADLRDLLTVIITRLGYETAVAISGKEAVESVSATQCSRTRAGLDQVYWRGR